MITVLGWIWWLVLPLRRKLAVANHQAAFPERDAGELRRTVGELAWSYVELLLGKRAQIEGLEHLEGGAIALAGHFGGWDLAMVSLAEATPVTVFVREPRDRIPAWIIRRIRRRTGMELLAPRGDKAAAYTALERGRVVLFIQDQRHDDGLLSPYFGRPVRTSAGFAAMAWRCEAKPVGIEQWRDDNGRHQVRIRPLELPIPDDREQALAALTDASQRFYEQVVRRRPWAWWWLHDRWR